MQVFPLTSVSKFTRIDAIHKDCVMSTQGAVAASRLGSNIIGKGEYPAPRIRGPWLSPRRLLRRRARAPGLPSSRPIDLYRPFLLWKILLFLFGEESSKRSDLIPYKYFCHHLIILQRSKSKWFTFLDPILLGSRRDLNTLGL